MSGLKRNVYFWGKTMHKQMLAILGYIVVFVFIFALAGGGDIKSEIMDVFPTYFIMLIVLIPFMNALGGSTTFLPISVSFGTTRKASYTGMQIMQHLIMAEYLFIAAVVFYWGAPEILETGLEYIFVLIGVVCLLIALGNLVAIVNYKFGKTAGVITYIILAMVVIFGITGLMMVESNSVLNTTLDFLTDKQYMALIGVVLDLVSVYVFYKVMQKSNLQF